MKIVRDAAVKAVDTAAKIRNWIARLLMPMKPAKAAASAPIPNQSSTKPDVKISATTSIAPRMHHRTQNQSLICSTSALREILQDKPDVRRAFGQPAHEVRIPVFSVRHIDPHVEAVACQLMLKVASHAIQHLKLILLFSNPFTRGEVDRRVDHLRIVCGDPVINAAA